MKKLGLLLITLALMFGIALAQDTGGETGGMSETGGTEMSDMPATVVDVAASNPDFSTLVSAVETAGLAETLSSEGPFTVFAPTNEAFAAAAESMGVSEEELLTNPDLSGILTYHVVPQELLAADVMAAVEEGGGTAEVETVNGETLSVEVVDGSVMLNGNATVTTTDLQAGNGVVHVIDAVLVPSMSGGDSVEETGGMDGEMEETGGETGG